MDTHTKRYPCGCYDDDYADGFALGFCDEHAPRIPAADVNRYPNAPADVDATTDANAVAKSDARADSAHTERTKPGLSRKVGNRQAG